MFWSFSFQLLPDEKVIDDSTRRPSSGIKASYSVFLTDKRAIFRFDGLGSSLTQSFFYHEINDVKLSKRIFISYLELKTAKRDFLLNVSDAGYWADKIQELKKAAAYAEAPIPQTLQVSAERKKRELIDMLTVLRKHSLLTSEEFEEKIHRLDSMKL